jgi:hypothetical protein
VSTAPLWLAATVVVPGATALLALSRRISPPVPTALALVLALGYTVSGSVALVLALAHVFSTAAFAIGLVAAVAALLTVALSSGRPPRPAWVRRPAEAELPALAAGGLGLAVVAFSALRVDPAVNLTSGGRWRYWADGREIAVLGHVPSSVHQWGASYPTTVSKVFLNAFTAGFSSLAGADVLPGYGALYLLGLVGTAAALWALAWELELRATSPLVPLLCAAFLHLHGVGVSERFAGIEGLYKAEWIGRMVAFTSLALAIRGLRRGERSSLLLGGGLLAVAAVTHGVPTLVVLLLGVAYLAAWSVAERRPRQAAVAVLTVALPATLVAGVVLLAAGGNLGFGGATSPYVEVNGADPTALFTGSGRGLRSGTFYLQPWLLAKRLAEAGLSTEPGTLVMVLLIVAVAAAAVLGLWRMPRDLAPLPATAALFGLLLWLVAVAFSARSHAYIPATFGQRRLFDFANLAVLLAVLPWLELAARRFAGHGRRTLVPALAAVAVAAAVAHQLQPAPVGSDAGRLAAAMNAVHANVPCGARILPNRRSNAAFEVLAGRESVLEGMAPYLRPTMLSSVLTQIRQAEQVLRGDPAGRDLLRREGIGYVVLLSGKSGSVSRASRRQALAQAEGLQQVYADRNVVIYRVDGAPPPGQPAPGFDCQAPPVRT